VYDRALVTLAAEQVGGARRCLEMATDYAKLRVAFGRRIGSFQAIKHKCADMLVATELAESTAAYAASITDAGPELSIAAAVAKSACSDAFLDVARANVQVHGGIGFTWEHGAHRYFKRAKASQLLFGAPVQQRARLGELLGWSA
jgi:alkylation response protein AidB-like acyl-CoA dehydrogenase